MDCGRVEAIAAISETGFLAIFLVKHQFFVETRFLAHPRDLRFWICDFGFWIVGELRRSGFTTSETWFIAIAVLKRGQVCPMPYALCPMPYARSRSRTSSF